MFTHLIISHHQSLILITFLTCVKSTRTTWVAGISLGLFRYSASWLKRVLALFIQFLFLLESYWVLFIVLMVGLKMLLWVISGLVKLIVLNVIKK